ncbi:MAG TPA: glycosyltransferase family 2 protein [Ignavibacteriaceae bacterium]|nr:glycosyltransferase family 2 protein [Ignavibacteriaceae bacterium]
MKYTLPQVSIIILNWNGSQDTMECLKSLNNVTYRNIEIIVVDNGSKEAELRLLEDFLKGKDVTFIKNKTNLGFTGGNNVGIKKALSNKADFILILNNDTMVSPGFIEPLLSVFNKSENAGIVAPQINYYNNKKLIWSAGGKIDKMRGSGFAISDQYERENNKIEKSVGFVSGCCMLVKREVFEVIGIFDENYFAYVEDTDLCYRTIQDGFKIFVAGNSKIYHKVSRSTIKNLTQLPLYYVTRNRLYFAGKNLNYLNYLVVRLYLIVTMFFKTLLWSVSGKRLNISTVIKAFSDFDNDKMNKTDHNKFRVV